MTDIKLFQPPEDEPSEPFEDLPPDPVSHSQARSTTAGKEHDQEAFRLVEASGGRIVKPYIRVHGYPLDALVEGANGRRFYLDGHGTPDRTDHNQAGMRRTDTMLKFGFKALRLHDRRAEYPLLLVTSHLPSPGSQAAYHLNELAEAVLDVVAVVGDFAGQQRLQRYLTDDTVRRPAFRRVA